MKQEKNTRLLTAEELKSGGFIPQRQKDLVAVRCRAPGGRLTADKLRKLADVAEKYGDGTVHLSARMSPEILYVNMKDIAAIVEELGSLWASPIATCGSRVRVPTACGGCGCGRTTVSGDTGAVLDPARRIRRAKRRRLGGRVGGRLVRPGSSGSDRELRPVGFNRGSGRH